MKFAKDKDNKLWFIGIAMVMAAILVLPQFEQSGQTKDAMAQVTGNDVTGDNAVADVTADDVTADVAAQAEELSAETTKAAAPAEAVADVSADTPAEAAATEDAEEESEYADLAIADVTDYVNVRSEPNTDSEILGKMYDKSVAHILGTAGENDEWLKVISGKVEGYIKAEYFIYGDEAAEVAPNYVTRYAVVKADRLNVRKEPSIESDRIGYIDNGERVKLVEWGDEWSIVNYVADRKGYVASQYVTIEEEFIYAKSIEEEKAEMAALLARQERAQTSEQAAPERAVISVPPPQTNYATVSDLRMAIVNYAMQYLGNRYIMGGQSLATGTDCSGFTCYIYKEFGYSLSRTPQGQYTSAGRAIDMSQVQPGDIICYSSNRSSCTHVGLYIGNGQIIHSANSRKGVIISNVYYDNTFLAVRSVLD